jgi:Tat protein translocase TatB subunit
MFGIGVTEIILILIVALVIVGPEKLPELVKTVAKGFNEFKRATNDIKRTIEGDSGLSNKSSASSNNEAPKEEKGSVEDVKEERAGKESAEPSVEDASLKKPKTARKKPAPRKRAQTNKAAPKKATVKKAAVGKRAVGKSNKEGTS